MAHKFDRYGLPIITNGTRMPKVKPPLKPPPTTEYVGKRNKPSHEMKQFECECFAKCLPLLCLSSVFIVIMIFILVYGVLNVG